MTFLDFPLGAKEIPDGAITTHELCRRSGISYRQADYWTRTDILRTAMAATPGSGYVRGHPTTEVAFAVLLKQLLDAGISLRPAAVTLARQLLEHGHAEVAGIRIDLPQDL